MFVTHKKRFTSFFIFIVLILWCLAKVYKSSFFIVGNVKRSNLLIIFD